jgi:hypothetical protein
LNQEAKIDLWIYSGRRVNILREAVQFMIIYALIKHIIVILLIVGS